MWLSQWTQSKKIEQSDRVFHEVKTLVEIFQAAGAYDQLNVGGVVCIEVCCRRLMGIIDAYKHVPHAKPSWDSMRFFEGHDTVDDGISTELMQFVTKKAKEETDIEGARQRARAVRGGVGGGVRAVGDEGSDGQGAHAMARPKAKGGQARGVAPAEAP